MFCVVPQRLPKTRPCGLRHTCGTPNLRQTSGPPPFRRYTPFGLRRGGELECVVGVVAIAMAIDESLECPHHLKALLASKKGVRQVEQHVAVDNLRHPPDKRSRSI